MSKSVIVCVLLAIWVASILIRNIYAYPIDDGLYDIVRHNQRYNMSIVNNNYHFFYKENTTDYETAKPRYMQIFAYDVENPSHDKFILSYCNINDKTVSKYFANSNCPIRMVPKFKSGRKLSLLINDKLVTKERYYVFDNVSDIYYLRFNNILGSTGKCDIWSMPATATFDKMRCIEALERYYSYQKASLGKVILDMIERDEPIPKNSTIKLEKDHDNDFVMRKSQSISTLPANLLPGIQKTNNIIDEDNVLQSKLRQTRLNLKDRSFNGTHFKRIMYTFVRGPIDNLNNITTTKKTEDCSDSDTSCIDSVEKIFASSTTTTVKTTTDIKGTTEDCSDMNTSCIDSVERIFASTPQPPAPQTNKNYTAEKILYRNIVDEEGSGDGPLHSDDELNNVRENIAVINQNQNYYKVVIIIILTAIAIAIIMFFLVFFILCERAQRPSSHDALFFDSVRYQCPGNDNGGNNTNNKNYVAFNNLDETRKSLRKQNDPLPIVPGSGDGNDSCNYDQTYTDKNIYDPLIKFTKNSYVDMSKNIPSNVYSKMDKQIYKSMPSLDEKFYTSMTSLFSKDNNQYIKLSNIYVNNAYNQKSGYEVPTSIYKIPKQPVPIQFTFEPLKTSTPTSLPSTTPPLLPPPPPPQQQQPSALLRTFTPPPLLLLPSSPLSA
jgi:hypothetical protein